MRASQADGAALEASLAASGLSAAPRMADAELVVLNTCTVTATADDELRQFVRRIHRAQPDTHRRHGLLCTARARGNRRAAGCESGRRQLAQNSIPISSPMASTITARSASAIFSNSAIFFPHP